VNAVNKEIPPPLDISLEVLKAYADVICTGLRSNEARNKEKQGERRTSKLTQSFIFSLL